MVVNDLLVVLVLLVFAVLHLLCDLIFSLFGQMLSSEIWNVSQFKKVSKSKTKQISIYNKISVCTYCNFELITAMMWKKDLLERGCQL
jgi:hypothetical protein